MIGTAEPDSLALRLLSAFRARGLTLVTAESCTGGLIAATLTEIPGSSDVVDCGFVTYSNDAKTRMLDVAPDVIAAHGAVSEAVARAMAEGALVRSDADVSVSVTGVAGPGGGTVDKPVGLVHFAAARRSHTTIHAERRFGGIGRREIRTRSVATALKLALRVAES
jgi:nicotinamide-nucleotide amidase